MDEEKLNQKLNSMQNDMTMMKLKMNQIIKLLTEVKNGKHDDRRNNNPQRK